MRIAQLRFPVHSLGPGERTGLWVQGCSRHCKGCISEEMQKKEGRDTDNKSLAELIIKTARHYSCRAITVSGGEPFEQAASLYEFLSLIRKDFDDILIYTSFLKEEIEAGAAGESGRKCLELTDVLIDGPYIEELNEKDCVLRGSKNQKIYIFKEELTDTYKKYTAQGRILETFNHNNTSVITGIINRGQ